MELIVHATPPPPFLWYMWAGNVWHLGCIFTHSFPPIDVAAKYIVGCLPPEWVASLQSVAKGSGSCSTSGSLTSCSPTGKSVIGIDLLAHLLLRAVAALSANKTSLCGEIKAILMALMCLSFMFKPCFVCCRLIKKLEHTWKALVHDGVSKAFYLFYPPI